MRIALLFAIFIFISSAYRSRRMRRQNVPSLHVQVFAFDSGVSLEGGTVVDSGENRIDFTERDIKGSLWSDHSLLKIDNMDSSSNLTADHPEGYFNIQGITEVHSQGNKGDAFVQTNRQIDSGFSFIQHAVYNGANFSFDDGIMKVQGIGGKWIRMEAETWKNDVPKLITFEAVNNPEGERELKLEATDKPYHAVICYVGAIIYFQYAGKYVKMDPTYRFIEIWTNKYTITVKTEEAPFNVTMSQNEIVILLKAENTRVCVFVDGVSIQAAQLAKTHIDRNGGALSIGGRPVIADGVMITALNTDLHMSNEGLIDSKTRNSYLTVQSNGNQIGLTAQHHDLKINDGIPHIVLDPGMSVVEITTNHGNFELSALMGPFVPPNDKFGSVGPFVSGHGGYGPPPGVVPPVIPPVMSPPLPPPQMGGPPGLPVESPMPPPVIPAEPPLGMNIPPAPPEAPPPPSPMTLNGPPPGLDMLQKGFAADMPPPKKNVSAIPKDLDALKAGFSADMPPPKMDNATLEDKDGHNGTDIESGFDPSNSTDLNNIRQKNTDDTDTIKKIDEYKTITDTIKDQKKKKPQIDPNLLKSMAADVPQVQSPTTTTEPTTPATTTTTTVPTTTTSTTTTTTTTTTPTTTTTTTSTTTMTTTTPKLTTTTTLSPMDELKKLREEMLKMKEKQYREWQEEQTSDDGDGDENVEEFTYPNGTTVHRVVKTRRKITTTVIHKHREEIKETSSNGTATGNVTLTTSTTKPTTLSKPKTEEEDLFSANVSTKTPTRKKLTLTEGETLPTISPLKRKT